MGALGMPPGPWLERAAANGLLEYTDAYNFHFYGHGADLAGVIAAHRAAIARLMKPETGRSARRGDGEANLPVAPSGEPGTSRAASAAARKPEGYRFWIERENTDPLAPTMAVAGVDGLSATGFLRLQLDKPMTKDRKVLVVLVDDRGQRYSIWENFGADYYGSRSDIWLNLEDFHADFWGPCSADYQFRPARIREVHLRFYLDDPNDPVKVGLSVLRAKG